MVRTGVQNAKAVARRSQVQGDLFHCGMRRIRKVNGHHTADGRGGLVHQPAGLAKEDIFRILPDLGQFYWGASAAEEELVEHGSDQHLKGGRGGESAAARDRGGDTGVQPGTLQWAA